MRPLLTAVIAAIEACAVALAGLVLVGIPAGLLWAATFGLAAEPDDVLAATAGSWLLAHFVPLHFEIGPEAALAFGLAPEKLGFVLSLTPLGVTAVTALLAARAGWRFAARGSVGAAGVLGGVIGFAVAATGIAAIAGELAAWPLWAAALVPALLYTIPAGLAFALRAARSEHDWWGTAVRALLHRFDRLGTPATAALPARAAECLRLAVAALAGLIGLGALGVAVSLVAGYVRVISLSQGLQLDPVGALLLFLLQLALLPVAVLWAVSWFAGAGFSIGVGTSVSPFETLLGPLPPLPLFGAIPPAWGTAGALAPVLVLLLGVGVGALAGSRGQARRTSLPVAIVTPLVAGALAGLGAAGLSALAQGALGPARLAETGPQAWLTGGLIAAELGLGLLLGGLAQRADRSRLRPRPERAETSLGGLSVPASTLAQAATPESAPGPESAAAPVPSAVRADAADEQETMPIEPLGAPEMAPVIRLPLAESSAARGSASPAGYSPEPTAGDPDEQVTEPLERLEPSPAREPELYDRVEADRAEADRAEAERTATEHDSEEEALLRAYSWENGQPLGEEPPRERRGWRPPWRKG